MSDDRMAQRVEDRYWLATVDDDGVRLRAGEEMARAEFRAWLAARDAKVRAEALTDLEPGDLADLLQGISEGLEGMPNRATLRRAADALRLLVPDEQAEDIDRMGPAAGCAYCNGAGGYEDYDGEWRECSCQRADRGCGHPNHGAEDHDCAPFIPDRERGQCAAEPVAYALYEKAGKRRGEWVLFTHAVSARDRRVYDVRPLYAHPETPDQVFIREERA